MKAHEDVEEKHMWQDLKRVLLFPALLWGSEHQKDEVPHQWSRNHHCRIASYGLYVHDQGSCEILLCVCDYFGILDPPPMAMSATSSLLSTDLWWYGIRYIYRLRDWSCISSRCRWRHVWINIWT